MKIKMKFGHWLPKKLGFTAITLYPFIFFAYTKEQAIRYNVVNHEWIHVTQIRKLGWFKFYIDYLWQYWVNYRKYKQQFPAYMAISYEVEAYHSQSQFPLPDEAIRSLNEG